MRYSLPLLLALVLPLLSLTGCATDTGNGALAGGALGAGAGALLGHAAGNTAAGAAIGAGVGALTGASVGSNMDADNARASAAQAYAAQAVTVPKVVEMTRAQVAEGLIINQIHTSGLVAPVRPEDVIYMQQQGVSPNVIAAMQSQPVGVPVYGPPGPVVDGGYYYGPGYYCPPPRVGIGFSYRR